VNATAVTPNAPPAAATITLPLLFGFADLKLPFPLLRLAYTLTCSPILLPRDCNRHCLQVHTPLIETALGIVLANADAIAKLKPFIVPNKHAVLL